MLEKIKTFLKEVGVQGKKIDWPHRKQALNYTMIVIGISFVAALFLGLLDFIFLKILVKFVF
jgi:preprotein translocase subunit SecE